MYYADATCSVGDLWESIDLTLWSEPQTALDTLPDHQKDKLAFNHI